MRHTFKKHGNPKVEAARGQKAITAADYSEIREITSRPDHVVLGADSGNNGEPRIVFTKRIGADTYTYVGEIRRGKRRIDMVTMWKK